MSSTIFNPNNYTTEEKVAMIKKAFGINQEPIAKKKDLIVHEVRLTIVDKGDNSKVYCDLNLDIEPVMDQHREYPELDTKEAINLDGNVTVNDIKDIIKNSGYLEKYKEYYVDDPNIIIEKYSVEVVKEFEKFSKFKAYVAKLQREKGK